MAEIWGICLSGLGCCSEDDGHHFKAEEPVIIRILRGSVEQVEVFSWFEFVCLV